MNNSYNCLKLKELTVHNNYVPMSKKMSLKKKKQQYLTLNVAATLVKFAMPPPIMSILPAKCIKAIYYEIANI